MPPTKRATSVKMSFRFAATQLNYHLSYVKICNAKKIHLYQRSIRHVRNEYLIMSQFYSTTFPKICQPFYEKIITPVLHERAQFAFCFLILYDGVGKKKSSLGDCENTAYDKHPLYGVALIE